MSNVSDTADLVQASILNSLEPRIMKADDGREFLVKPGRDHAWEHVDITPANKIAPIPPKIIAQAVKLQQVESLVAYVNRFKNADSLLFADIETSTILAVIDYHTGANQPAPDAPTAVPTARFTKHTATLQLPKSLEWVTWGSIDGRLMSHADFANFIEENANDILPLGRMVDGNGEPVEDAPTTVLELVRELQVATRYGASSAIRNGDYVSIEMQKGDDVSTKKNVQLPNEIDLNIPVYFGEQAVLVRALIRRRVDDGLKLGVKLVRPEQLRQDEFKRIVCDIEQDVALATHYGKPA